MPSDNERRDAIVATAQPSPRSATGIALDLRITLSSGGIPTSIRAINGGGDAASLRLNDDEEGVDSLTKILHLLRARQRQRAE